MTKPYRLTFGQAVERPTLRTMQRLFKKLKLEGECWVWCGEKKESGYGVMSVGKRKLRVHRLMYAFFNNESLEDLDVHHNCHNILCCNPDHSIATSRETNAAESNEWRRDCGATDEIPF